MESDNARSVSYSSDKFPPPSLVQARLTHTGMILYENLDIKIKVEIAEILILLLQSEGTTSLKMYDIKSTSPFIT